MGGRQRGLSARRTDYNFAAPKFTRCLIPLITPIFAAPPDYHLGQSGPSALLLRITGGYYKVTEKHSNQRTDGERYTQCTFLLSHAITLSPLNQIS